MSQKKILFLLILLVVLVNYMNYFQKDRDKLFQQINLLENKIKREHRLNQKDINISILSVDRFKYFFDNNKTYSQSMGDMQEMISKASNGVCEVSYIKWSQVPTSKKWYQYLQFDISLVCQPKDIIKFSNNIKKENKLMIFKDINIRKTYKKESLTFSSKIVGFKVKNETK